MILSKTLKLLVFLLLLGSSLALAERKGCSWYLLDQLQQDKLLFNQTDIGLKVRNLTVEAEGAGLCGPTCAINLFSMLDQQGHSIPFKKNPVEEVQKLYSETLAQKNKDIRYGMHSIELYNYIRNAVPESIEMKIVELNSKKALLPTELDPDMHMILTVRGVRPSGTETGHFVLVKGFDHEAKTITIADPNVPNSDTVISYEVQKITGGTYNNFTLLVKGDAFLQKYDWKFAFVSNIISIKNVQVVR